MPSIRTVQLLVLCSRNPIALKDFSTRTKLSLCVISGWVESGVNVEYFSALLEDLKAKGVPLTTSVLHTNRSAMSDRLVSIGFTKVEADTKETRLRWDPSG